MLIEKAAQFWNTATPAQPRSSILCAHTSKPRGEFMAKPNYSFQKKQRELAAKKKREEKAQRRQQKKEEEAPPPASPPPA
jgi:hypothetical protein